MGICPFFADVSGDNSKIATETVQCRGAACQIWNKEENNCSLAVTASMILHIHQAHWHSTGHPVEETVNVTGQPTTSSDLPYAAIVTQEYACFQDSDGNGKVFGLDFKFILDDYVPPAIAGVLKGPDLKNKDIPEISWRDLYNWRYHGGADPLANIPSRLGV